MPPTMSTRQSVAVLLGPPYQTIGSNEPPTMLLVLFIPAGGDQGVAKILAPRATAFWPSSRPLLQLVLESIRIRSRVGPSWLVVLVRKRVSMLVAVTGSSDAGFKNTTPPPKPSICWRVSF